MKKNSYRFALAVLTTGLIAPTALAQSALTWNSIKMSGAASPRPWCGQWWGHRCNGVAINSTNNKVATMGCGYTDTKSPIEKLDALMGRADKIEYAKLDKWLTCALASWGDCQGKSGLDRSKCLQDSSKSTKYRGCRKEHTTDTAYEYEIEHHGQGHYGWDTWWGHCNAWAAAAVLYPEPIKAVTHSGTTWTIADVKGLLTEALMDTDLAADGWFGCRYDGAGSTRTYAGNCATEDEVFRDVTPRQFISAFSKHIGTDRHGVVIDRHTDSEVWNQPVSEYALTNCRESDDAALCGTGAKKQTCDASFTWAEDGVGHAEVCTPPHGYTTRKLGMSVCVKDGNVMADRRNQRWDVPESIARSERWPDFIWVPGNLSSYADSSNPFVHKEFVKIRELARMSAGAVTPPTPTAGKSYTTSPKVAIPDNNPTGVTRTKTVNDTFVVKGVSLCLDVDHSYRGDLVVSVTNPAGITERVWDKQGGSEDNIKDCHDATNAAFFGRSAKGAWKISIVDTAAQDVGKWNKATLKLMK